MKKIIMTIALMCSVEQVFAHSSSNNGQGKEGYHKHSTKDVPHCH